jgi:AcrR family transcriptional regulator
MRSKPSKAGPPSPTPRRRLSVGARRQQFVEAAMAVVAAQGFAEFSLDEIAARAGVTRALLYHYFPRGRADVVLAVMELAGQEITNGWVVDDAIPVEQRIAANTSRMVAHAMQPTDAWKIHRMSRGAADPEMRQVIDRFLEVVISNMALNHVGTADPPPLARMVLRGYLAFSESVLDDVRERPTPPEQVERILNSTLVAALDAAAREERTRGRSRSR